MAIIVVMGATGHCGAGVAERLLRRGHQVRGLGRSRERLKPLLAAGADIRVGDLADPAYLADMLRAEGR